MKNNFINCLSAEWIKKRRSLASWLVVVGGFFIPFVNLLIFLFHPKQLLSMHQSRHFWNLMSENSWNAMAFMLLPMGIVLAVSLVTQLEFKNNTWKQLHTTPVSFANIYFAKLLVILLMLAQLFILFNIGIYLSALIPPFVNSKIPFPNYAMDAGHLLKENAIYFLVSMPLVALQYLISLRFKNFLVPVGVGLVLVVGGLMALSWEYIFVVPTAYTALHHLQAKSGTPPQHDLLLWSVGYFLVFSLVGFWLYISKKEKG